MMVWQHIDTQMVAFAPTLISEVKLSHAMAIQLGTSIAADVQFLSVEQKAKILSTSPVTLQDRLIELTAFQQWMDYAHTIQNNRSVTRAQVLTQNYICFVYLPEACFRVLSKECPRDSAAAKCAKFLSDFPVRAFRNAVAHSNWAYRPDFGAITYWARKDSDLNGPLQKYEIEQSVLGFWQALSRCVAYVAYSNL